MASRDSLLAGNRPNHRATAAVSRPGKHQRTSRLRTRSYAAAWPGGTQPRPATATARPASVSWAGTAEVTEPPPPAVPAERGAGGLAGQPSGAARMGQVARI